ncbi:MAG TPA: hypothetical protein EYP77_06265 [Anaerolineae bacterium]|nr:hypothetical protein [Anaerolineae bacterium]
MTMDLTQVSQMLKWLDEERRKDKTIIASLQERLESQTQQLARQEEQLAGLQETVAGLEALMARVTEFAQTVEQFKAEVGRMLDRRDEQRRKEQREAERSRQLEIGALKDEMAHLTEATRQITRLGESLEAVQAEGRRLNEMLQRLESAVADLGKRSDDRIQTVTYLEEQRRADNRRIAALEAETTELRKRAEATDAKMLLLEETVQRQRARLEEGLKPIQEFEKVVEEMRVADFRRSQMMKKWEGQAQEIRQEMERLQAERQQFTEQYQRAKRALEGLEAFQDRLKARQNEVAEMQRLAEDRLKRQWEEWQAGWDKEYRRWELEVEERWKRQERTNKKHAARLEKLQEQAAVLWQHIQANQEALLARAHLILETSQSWIEDLQERIQAVRDSARPPAP